MQDTSHIHRRIQRASPFPRTPCGGPPRSRSNEKQLNASIRILPFTVLFLAALPQITAKTPQTICKRRPSAVGEREKSIFCRILCLNGHALRGFANDHPHYAGAQSCARLPRRPLSAITTRQLVRFARLLLLRIRCIYVGDEKRDPLSQQEDQNTRRDFCIFHCW